MGNTADHPWEILSGEDLFEEESPEEPEDEFSKGYKSQQVMEAAIKRSMIAAKRKRNK
jgi:hypothetical protein|tara:strand:- start:56 stop:229 length:174 start_codon:yes stop_codon:yes gene_type:complete